MSRQSIPRIEYLRVKNYRALRDLELKGITPLTVFLGPNGSGKSTIFDVFAFLSECFTVGLRKAWDRRGRFRELRTRGADGAIVIELKYREKPDLPIITYHLAIAETPRGPYVAEEWLQWRRGQTGKPFKFLDFQEGAGRVITGEKPDEQDERVFEQLNSSELFAVNTLGQFSKHPRVSALRNFISSWYLSYLSADNTRSIPEAGPQERLSPTGDNLPNVIQYLKEQHPKRLQQILDTLSCRVPRLERVDAEMMQDGRLLLQIKDAPFQQPILAKFASDGTLKMLAYLTVLYDPDPPQLVGIEEPENYLHPRLLPELAEECRAASANTQLMVTTHSPFFVDGLKPEELWVLYRDEQGYTQAKRTADMRGVKDFMEQGATLGSLWMEDYFEVGNPLINAGGPKKNTPQNQIKWE
ncbi:ATPase [Richelia sinica FACHB-800]|uniref:ATPase n=1 Tax=Richelia sinica FACHB-800 TaxID=1357546 RepID=A0A975Y5Y6_9NOST|nr:AAA family ATPase [Richelia sinica]MBD2663516.1 AAA family ATPase [Richelia sinica FACHB-800]QXE24704.1 ATPase [Richelia sinica FACHB-800]